LAVREDYFNEGFAKSDASSRTVMELEEEVQQ
jgi:hypothetical protein